MSLVGAHITKVRVTGFQKKQKSHVYTIEVAWSDKMAFEIYRRYADFFSFQNSLMQKFPVEAGKGYGGQRVIPSLPTVDNVLSIIGCINSKRVMQSRLKKINTYCQTLIQLSPKISHSELVTDFFGPVPGDKQLRLNKTKRVLSLYPMKRPAGSFEEFTLVEDYTPKEEDRKQHLTAKAGEVVKVLQKKDSGWWMVCKSSEDGKDKIGWLPESYLRPHEAEDIGDCLGTCSVLNGMNICHMSIDSSESEEADTAALSDEDSAIDSDDGSEQLMPDTSVTYFAIADYYTDDTNQVNFPKGARIIVIDKDEDGWWFVSYNGVEGWAPSSFLEQEGTSGMGHSVSEEQYDIPVSEEPKVFFAAVDYEANKEEEVSFPRGAQLEVLKKSLLGWWTVRYQGQTGLAPATYLVDQPPPAANCSGQVKKRKAYLHCASDIILPPPRRSDVIEGFRVKDDAKIRQKASASGGKRDRVSTVSSRQNSSSVTSPRNIAISEEKVEKDMASTNQDEIMQGPPQKVPNWVPSPRPSFIAQVEEKKRRHSLMHINGGVNPTWMSYPLKNTQLTASSCKQGRRFSAACQYEICPTPQRLSGGGHTLDSCPVTPQLDRNSTSSKLVRRHAFRRPWKSCSQVFGDSNSAWHGGNSSATPPDGQRSAILQPVKRDHSGISQSLPQHRRYSLQVVNSQARDHSLIPATSPVRHSPGSCTMTFFPPFGT